MLLLVVSLLHLATASCLSSELRVHGSQGGAEEVQVPLKFKRNLSSDYSASALVERTADEAEVLLDFKSRLSSTTKLADWTAINSQKVCNWTGIHCEPLKHNVVSMQLDHLELEGTITPMLGQLKHLQLLNLSHNDLKGPIPESIGQFQKLQKLDLSWNLLNGSIPLASLGNCTRLEVLDLSFNNFESTVISKVPASLRSLDLSGNNLNLPSSLFLNCTLLEEILLDDNNLTAEILVSIGNLKNLRRLYLSDNNLGNLQMTDIFTSFSNLSQVEYLHLSDNSLSGGLPNPALFPLLRHLDLSDNSFSGGIPGANWSSTLEVLDLSWNNFESTVISKVPASLRSLDLRGNNLEDVNLPSSSFLNCTLLEEILLDDNNLTAEILVSIGNLKNLRQLYLSDNNLTGNFPNLSDQAFSKLEDLDLSDNSLSGGLPNPALFPSLRHLYLSQNSFSGGIPGANWSSTLEALDLDTNNLSGTIPTNWSSSLREMYLSHNQLRGPIPFLDQLEILNVIDNQLSGNVPASLGLKCSALQALHLSDNNLSGLLPSSLGNCSSLTELTLSNNRLEGEIFKDVLAQLEYLPSFMDVASNRFTGDILLRDSNYTSKTEIINLGHNNFSGSIPMGVCNISPLFFLSLTSNNLQGSIPSCITNLTNIRFLDLSSNNLTGLIPRNLGRLAALTVPKAPYGYEGFGFDMIKDGHWVRYEDILEEMALFDLSNNSLEGEIPATLGQLSGIKFLNLSHNNLSGSIPWELGNISHLESLDLSHNHLQGPIPSSIAALDLSSFNVANNNLSGSIPTADSSFNTRFNASSFEGNPGLHGCPLQPCAWGSQPRRPTPPIQQHTNEDNEQQKGLFTHFSAWSFFSAALIAFCVTFSITLFGNPLHLRALQ